MSDYAVTLFDEKGIFNHIVFKIKTRLKRIENLTETWEVFALLDTGATMSAISTSLVKRMGIKSDTQKEFSTVQGQYKAAIYTVDVILPKEKVIENVSVVEVSDDKKGYDFIIGMDIIRMGDMAITSKEGKLAFSFRMPPKERYIDFEESDTEE